jgi:CRP/FNR family cyclic AMP-dependent transcriptional regulator
MPVIDPNLLREIPLFEMFDNEELGTLCAQMEEVNILSGQRVFSMGDPSGKMFVVQEGRVELYLQDKADERVHLGVVERGDMFGELGLLHNEPRTASAKALENTRLIAIDRHDLEILFTQHPHAALDMMTMLGKRIREANALVRERVVSRNVNEVVESATFGERISDFLTMIAGDIRFVYFSVAWFTIWLLWNSGTLGLTPFDPNPYGLLTMIVSLEAIFLSLFVLISQNRQAAREKVRNDIEYEVNLKAELEIRSLAKQVEDLQDTLLQHLNALEAFQASKQTKETNSIKKQNNEGNTK